MALELLFLAAEDPASPQSGSAWLPWIGLVGIGVLAGIVNILLQLLARLRGLEQRLVALDRLAEIHTEISKLGEQRGGPDLRRLEHVLIDMRDGQKRLDERLMRIAETERAAHGETDVPAASAPTGRAPYSERIVNRLLAMGYERIRVLTPHDEIAGLFEEGGEILVEARQEGATCKGRVSVQGGAIVAAELTSAHSMFP